MAGIERPVREILEQASTLGSSPRFRVGIVLQNIKTQVGRHDILAARVYGSHHWLPESEKHRARDLDLLFVVKGKGVRFLQVPKGTFNVNAVVIGQDSLEKEARSKGFGFFSAHVVSPGDELKGSEIFDAYRALAVKTAVKPIARLGGLQQGQRRLTPTEVETAIRTWVEKGEPDFVHRIKSVRAPRTRFERWLARKLKLQGGWMDYPEHVDAVVQDLAPHFEAALAEKLPKPTRFPRTYSAFFKPATLALRLARQLVTMRRVST